MKSFNRWVGMALVTSCAGLLGSCGGGGGGSGGSSGGGSGSLTFTANRTSLTFDYMEGTTAPSLDVVVNATGNYSGTLYLGATATGTGLNSTIPLVVNSESQGTFTVTAASGLAVGDYTGTLRLMACSDQACNKQVGNSPLNLTYTTRVHTRLHVSSNAVTLASHSDSGTTSDIAVTLPWQATAFTATVEMGSDFLSVNQPNSTTLRLSARAWPSGQRSGVVRVDSGGLTEMISVTYDVTPPTGGEFNLRSTPTELTLSAIERTSTTPTTVTVLGPTWEPGLATETFTGYSAQGSGAEWLQVETVAGGYRLTASAAQLNAGTYTANFVVRATSSVVPSQQIEIPVSFTVGEGLAQPADRDVTLDANTSAQSSVLSGSIPVTLVAGPEVTWTAHSDSNWLTFSRGSGQTGTTLDYVIDPALLDLTTSFGHRDFVATVQVTTTPFLTPRTFHVNLHQRLAHVRGISPYYQVQGRTSRHVVRGDGFIANRDWSQHLYVMGAPAGAGKVTRVNDTELVVDVGAGQLVIEAHNELSPVASWDPIRLVSPAPSTYQALDTGFEVKKLHYDALREYLLVLDTQERFSYLHHPPSSPWSQAPAVVIPGLRDFFVTNDNSSMWLVTDSGLQFVSLWAINFGGGNLGNPNTTFSPLHIADANSAMAMTNDWRVWFGSDNGSGVGTGIRYRDILAANGENVPLESDLIQPYDGPWFTVSGNGERLYISQSASIVPRPPLLALDAKDGQLFEVPDQGDANYLPSDAAINLDGSRLISAGYIVRDLAYQDIGHVNPVHQNYMAVASAIDPSGTRAYVLAYDESDLPNPTPQSLPRVYVFNLTAPVQAGQRLPVVGYFTVPDYPTCRSGPQCRLTSRATLAPDGNTLFIAGNAKLLVVPVPAENTLTPANKIRPPGSGIVTTPWRVNTRSH